MAATGSPPSTGTSPARKRATSSTTAGRRRSSPAPRTRRPAAEAARAAPGTSVLLAVGGEIDGFESLRGRPRGRGRRAARRRHPRRPDALHVGHHRPPEGRHPVGRRLVTRGRQPGGGEPHHDLRLRGGRRAPVQRAPVPRGPARLLAVAADRQRGHRRAHGRLGRGGDAPAGRGPRRHPHAPGADDVRAAAEAAARRARPLRHLVAAPRPARRGAVPAQREVGPHRLDRVRSCGSTTRPPKASGPSSTRRRGSRRRAPSGGSSPSGHIIIGDDDGNELPRGEIGLGLPPGARRRALRVLRRRREDRRPRTGATTSRSATSATWTTTASCSSPTAAPT